MKESEKEKQIALLVEEALNKNLFTSAAVGMGRLGLGLHISYYGGEASESSLFDLASLTKVLATSPLVLQRAFSVIEDRKQEVLDQKVGVRDFLKAADTRLPSPFLDLSIASLLEHRSGLLDWFPFWQLCFSREKACKRPYERPSESLLFSQARLASRLGWIASQLPTAHRQEPRPTSSYVYSDIGYIALAWMLEDAAKESFASLFDRYLCSLGLSHEKILLGFSEALIARTKGGFVSTGFCPLRERVLCGEVHDENAWVLGGHSGHAGLFSSLLGLSELIEAFFRNTLGQKMLELFRQAALKGDKSCLLGWHPASFYPSLFSTSSFFSQVPSLGVFQGQSQNESKSEPRMIFGHLGFTGTALFIDPKDLSYFLLLTNRVAKARVPSAAFQALRASLFSLFLN